MAVEDITPGQLPGFHDLQSAYETDELHYLDIFDNFRNEFDVPYPEQISKQHADLLDYAPDLSRALYGSAGEDKEARATVSRGLFFGMAVRRALDKATGGILIYENLIQCSQSLVGDADNFGSQANRYLLARPKLWQFIGRYIANIAPNISYADAAQAATGFMLWDHEYWTLERLSRVQSTQLNIELDELLDNPGRD